MANSYTLLPAKAYVTDMIESIKRSKHQVEMIALTIAEDDTTRELIDALCQASQRGVNVSIGLDIYFTYREIEKTSWHRGNFWRRVQLMRETKKRLQRAGAKVRWLGQYGVVIFARRTHTKWSIVDDNAYTFGGVNLYRQGIDSVDYMFKVKDSSLVQKLSKEHQKIIKYDKSGLSYRSHLFGTVSHTALIDGGRFFDSIIYRHALMYAREATHIIYISQYSPSGRLGRAMKSHPNTELYFNPWQNADDPLNRTFLRVTAFFRGYSTLYTKTKYLHAKCMIFTMPNGKRIAITGSHNFVAGGGYLGTREVALETTDPGIISQIEDFLDKYVRS